jgi:hypothetical protein
MLHIPVELRRHCIEFLTHDTETLKTVRLSCKDLSTLASQTLFRTAILNHNEKSPDNFKRLTNSSLNDLVRHVIINTRGHWSTDDPGVQGPTLECEIVDSFVEAIELLSQVEKLEEVELKFSAECQASFWDNRVAETKHFRERILVPFFGALAKADNVESLTIKNLQDDMSKEVFESEDFKAVRGRLKKLHLQIATESNDAGPEYDIEMADATGGFTQSLPNYWLKPMTTQLTHLTLWSTECLWGIWPFMDLRKIPTFSRLKSLYLGNLTIAHDWQIDWIVSHKTTLVELVFYDCPIIVALMLNKEHVEINFPNLSQIKHTISKDEKEEDKDYLVEVELRWHHVFDRLREGLPLLRHLAVYRGDWDFRKGFEDRYDLEGNCPHDYRFFEHGVGPSPWRDEDGYSFYMPQDGEDYTEIASPQCDKEDEQAMAALMEIVQQKANIKSQKWS